MDNSYNSNSGQNTTSDTRTEAEKILGVSLSQNPSSPSNGQTVMKQQKMHSPKRAFALIGAGVIAFVLVVVGVVVFNNYEARDENGNTIGDLQSKIDALEPKLNELATKESTTFKETGFSQSFFEAANDAAEVKSEKASYEDSIEKLRGQANEKTIITTGAAWFFVAALVVMAIGITAFLRM